MHSWRVLILSMYDRVALAGYDFDEPWNSPNNLKLDGSMFRRYFSCPNAPNHENTSMTNYVVVTGPQTAFPRAKSASCRSGPKAGAVLARSSHERRLSPFSFPLPRFSLRS